MADIASNRTSVLDAAQMELSVSELTLSRWGVLYLLALRASHCLEKGFALPFKLSVFNDHMDLLMEYIDESITEIDSPILLDSIIILGWAALVQNEGYEIPDEDEIFYEYLHRLNMISSFAPFACLRYQYHFFSSTIARSHPSSRTRLEYIKDTLQCCPFENVKTTAVNWVRTELAAAFKSATTPDLDAPAFVKHPQPSGQDDGADNVFASATGLSEVAPLVFVPPADVEEAERPAKGPFWIAALNLLYFIYSSTAMPAALNADEAVDASQLRQEFIPALKAIVYGRDSASDERIATMALPLTDCYALEDGIARVESVMGETS